MGLKDRDYYWEERSKKGKGRSSASGPPDLLAILSRNKTKLLILLFLAWTCVLMYIYFK